MIKKIFAVVSEDDFYRFRKRAYSEHRTFGEALTALAMGYIKGDIVLGDDSRPKEKKKTENVYLNDITDNVVGKLKGGKQNS